MSCFGPSACDLAWIQSAISEFLPDTCTLRNPGTPTRGTAGGVVAAAPVNTLNVACLLDESGTSGDVVQVAERLQLVNPAVIHFAVNQAHLTEQTQVLIGSRAFNVRAIRTSGALAVETLAVVDEIR